MNSATITRLRLYKPKVFTTQEAFMEELQSAIFASGIKYKDLASMASVANSTIANIANGTTRWPRHTTLFPLIAALNLEITFKTKRNI